MVGMGGAVGVSTQLILVLAMSHHYQGRTEWPPGSGSPWPGTFSAAHRSVMSWWSVALALFVSVAVVVYSEDVL